MKAFVPFPRDIENTAVFESEGLLKVFIWCFYRAAYKERLCQVVIGRGTSSVHLIHGQFIFGRHTAAQHLKMSESTVWKRMRKLEKLGFLNINSNSHYSIVTVLNLATCDDVSEKSDRKRDSQGDSQGEKPAKKPSSTPDSENDDFTKFWAAYPKREKKAEALRAFSKMVSNGSLPNIDVLLAAIVKRKGTADWIKDGGQYIPLPTSWLNGRRWEDEISGNVRDAGAAKQSGSQSSLYDRHSAAWEVKN